MKCTADEYTEAENIKSKQRELIDLLEKSEFHKSPFLQEIISNMIIICEIIEQAKPKAKEWELCLKRLFPFYNFEEHKTEEKL